MAVTVAFHAGLFNIGGEGQAQLGGLGVALVCLVSSPGRTGRLRWWRRACGAALFGAAWAAIPAYLQAKRGSHIVITTIMFNYIAASLMIYHAGRRAAPPRQDGPGHGKLPRGGPSAQPERNPGAEPDLHSGVPANVTFFIALALACWCGCCSGARGWATRSAPSASRNRPPVYAGINPTRITMIAMLISGGACGPDGDQQRDGRGGAASANSAEGAGFIGIAVALMGRNHPIGVFLAALLFGFLYQGGAELGLWTNDPASSCGPWCRVW